MRHDDIDSLIQVQAHLLPEDLNLFHYLYPHSQRTHPKRSLRHKRLSRKVASHESQNRKQEPWHGR